MEERSVMMRNIEVIVGTILASVKKKKGFLRGNERICVEEN